jgi:ribosomal-protein-alanine N-acetyltransferase
LIADDAEWLADLLADAEVGEFLWDRASTRERARRAAHSMISLDLMRSQFGQWAIQEKSTGAVHGWTELSKLRPWSGPSDEIALSYVLRRSSWGQGIATEAAGRLLRCAFEVHGLDRVMAVIMSGNLASKRVLEKLNMRFVASAESAGRTLVYYRIEAAADQAAV